VSSRSLLKIQHLSNYAGLIFANQRAARGSISDSKLGSLYFCAHTGASMYPTLHEPDLLEIDAHGDRPIRIGDVIFFMPPNGDCPAVHRVVSVTPEGLQTKGDNNSSIDPWFIPPQDVIGRVVRAKQGTKQRPIYGGRVGQLWSFWMRGLKEVVRCLSFFYHPLARSGFLRRLVPLHKRMRIVVLHRKGGSAFKLLLGDWVIGNYQPGMHYWQIRRPFRLFVDERSLPK
jgi:signal peptidase